jgi:hypothetical protein
MTLNLDISRGMPPAGSNACNEMPNTPITPERVLAGGRWRPVENRYNRVQRNCSPEPVSPQSL